MNKTCSFFGHKDLFGNKEHIIQQLKVIITDLVEKGVDTFYVGNNGDFDALSSRVVCDMKTLFPQMNVILVLSYANELQYVKNPCDDFLLPPEVENNPKRIGIVCKNKWVVEHSDYVVSCIKYPFGGAAKAINYAKKKNKQIIKIEMEG